MLRRSLLLLALLAGCSSEEAKNEKTGRIGQNETWADGTALAGQIDIPEGVTVDVAAGAKLTCNESTNIRVGGTLRIKSPATNRASIHCNRWIGIAVAQRGVVELEGVDLDNPDQGVETTAGAGSVTLTDVSINASVRPFLVGPNSTLIATRVKATTPTTVGFDTSVSRVYGKLVAKYLDYNASVNEGIMAMRGGELDIEDSVISGEKGNDLVSSYGGKSFKLRYTTLKGNNHCGVHLQPSEEQDILQRVGAGNVEIDHVTSESNTYAITIWGLSMEGPHTIKNSNFLGVAAWIDMYGDHGPIAFENIFTEGSEDIRDTVVPTFGKAPAKVDAAKPR